MSFPNAQNNPAGSIPVYYGYNVIASDGIGLPLDSLAQSMGYNGSGQLVTISVVYLGNTYIQTYSYTSGNLTGVSLFVKQ